MADIVTSFVISHLQTAVVTAKFKIVCAGERIACNLSAMERKVCAMRRLWLTGGRGYDRIY